MNESTTLNLVRSILMLVGGAVAGSGYMTSDNWTAIVGGIVAVATVIWDHSAHKATAAKLAAAAPVQKV